MPDDSINAARAMANDSVDAEKAWQKAKINALKLFFGTAALSGGALAATELLRRMGQPTPGYGKKKEDELPAIDLTLLGRKRRRRVKRAASDDYEYVNALESSPLAVPLYAASAIGGTYAGYRGVKWLIDQIKKKERQKELQRAEQRFEEALMNTTQKRAMLKAAMDVQYGAFVKLAERSVSERLWEWVKNKGRLTSGSPSIFSGNLLAGIGLSGAGAAWLMSHLFFSNVFGKSKNKQLLKALRRAHANRLARSGAPIEFELPVDIEKQKEEAEQQELPFSV